MTTFIDKIRENISNNGLLGAFYVFISQAFAYVIGPYKTILTITFAVFASFALMILGYNSSAFFLETSQSISHDLFGLEKDWFSKVLFWTSLPLFYLGMIAADGFFMQNIGFFSSSIGRFLASTYRSARGEGKIDISLITNERFLFVGISAVMVASINYASIEINYSVFAKKQQKQQLANLKHTNLDGMFIGIDTVNSPIIKELGEQYAVLLKKAENTQSEIKEMSISIHGKAGQYGSKQIALAQPKNELARMAYEYDLSALAVLRQELAETQLKANQTYTEIKNTRKSLSRRNQTLENSHTNQISEIKRLAWWKACFAELILLFFIPFASIGTRNMRNLQTNKTATPQANNKENGKQKHSSRN